MHSPRTLIDKVMVHGGTLTLNDERLNVVGRSNAILEGFGAMTDVGNPGFLDL
jgi:hypothetical protein